MKQTLGIRKAAAITAVALSVFSMNYAGAQQVPAVLACGTHPLTFVYKGEENISAVGKAPSECQKKAYAACQNTVPNSINGVVDAKMIEALRAAYICAPACPNRTTTSNAGTGGECTVTGSQTPPQQGPVSSPEKWIKRCVDLQVRDNPGLSQEKAREDCEAKAAAVSAEGDRTGDPSYCIGEADRADKTFAVTITCSPDSPRQSIGELDQQSIEERLSFDEPEFSDEPLFIELN